MFWKIAVLVLVLCQSAWAAERVTYIYREADGSILYTNVKPRTLASKGYVYLGSVNLPPVRTRTPSTSASRSIDQERKPLAPRARAVDPKSACASRARSRPFDATIARHARAFGVDKHLVRAIVSVESCFNPRAVSHAGAQGLMQLMPSTARHVGVKDSFDQEQNIRGGVRYLKEMLKRFPSDTKLALAAYNAGPGAVRKYGGIPPYKETQNYVRKVMARYQTFTRSG